MTTKIVKDDTPWNQQPCRHPNHNPPTHIVIPQGSKLEHTCPGCGNTVVLKPIEIWLK